MTVVTRRVGLELIIRPAMVIMGKSEDLASRPAVADAANAIGCAWRMRGRTPQPPRHRVCVTADHRSSKQPLNKLHFSVKAAKTHGFKLRS